MYYFALVFNQNVILYNIEKRCINNGVNYEKIVIIDAGHGGEDGGAVGIAGSLEKDINLQINL